ncbi:MAG: bifunctional indole-3-glycerol-phosphate synthase TrpC/phosphoribosylanthranilate isomerase TrpF [Pseudomonadota bacterium]
MGLSGFLKTVIDLKKKDVEQARTRIPLAAIREQAEADQPRGQFLKAMAMGRPGNAGIIAEIKKASPSKGDIRPDLDPAEYARRYTEGGARAISVLTEPHFFKGSLQDLKDARGATDLPVLRKDFTISSYQIYEARAAGADSILLITSILSVDQLRDYVNLTRELGMEPLVEIHSEWEFERTVACDAKIIGINNRNLQTLETDLTIAHRLAPFFLPGQIPVEASGISSREDIQKGLDAAIHNFLVGESIVRAKDTRAFIRELCETGSDKGGHVPVIHRKGNRPMVKICGLTDPEEAAACARAGADAIGLVFYPKSPRAVTLDQAARISRALPPDIISTGVFVNENLETILETVLACSLKAVQLHGQEPPNLVAELARTGLLVIKALFVDRAPFLVDAADFPMASALLVEHGKGALPGGNAMPWNWKLVRSMNRNQALILAGGLSPENIADALAEADPDAVDVSSGVESSPGRKNLDAVQTFIRLVKS